MIIIYVPLSSYANNDGEEHRGIRRVTISGIRINIPRNFLIGSSALKNDENEKSLLLVFTYPEIIGGMGNGKNYVSIWLEDTREYNKAAIAVYEKLRAGQEFPKEEYDIFKQIILKRNEMIKEQWNGEIPFPLHDVRWDNSLMCDSIGVIPNPKCEYTFMYKDLYILIIFRAEDLNKMPHIKQLVLKLITQWESIS